MWILDDEERVLTPQEWACISIGLGTLRDYIQDDPDGEYGIAQTGVQIFDRLSASHRLAILADTCEAMTSPTVAAPKLTAVNEGTVAALLQSFWNQLVMELDMSDDLEEDGFPLLECRRALLAAFDGEEDPDTMDMLPEIHVDDAESWHSLFSLFESRFLIDTDYEMAALFDAPTEKVDELKAIMGIDDDYFVSIAPDPTEQEMHQVGQKLAKLLKLPCPDDLGRYPAIYDRYTGLKIGPCTDQEIASWSSNPWIQSTTLAYPSWDCEYRVWQTNFMDAMLAADPTAADESPDLATQREERRQAALEALGLWPEF